MTYADIQFLEILEGHVFLDGSSLIGGSLVGFLGGFQLVELLLDGGVFNLLEEQGGLTQLVAGFQQVGAAQLFPLIVVYIEHAQQFLAAERQEGFEGDGEVGHQLQGDVEDGLHALHVGLGHLPWLAVGDVFVADTGKVHGLLLGIAELEGIEQFLHVLLHILELFECLSVDVVEFAAGGNHSVPVFLGELQRTVHEVAVDSHEFVVVAVLEILPGEVVVFGLGGVGGEHVAQHILFAGEVNEIFVEPNSPVA